MVKRKTSYKNTRIEILLRPFLDMLGASMRRIRISTRKSGLQVNIVAFLVVCLLFHADKLVFAFGLVESVYLCAWFF